MTLTWDVVDFDRQEARIVDHKTKSTARTARTKILHLPPPALSVLAELPRPEDNSYVIVCARRGCHLVNPNRSWRVIREAAGLGEVRIHDLRHSFGGIGASSGMSVLFVGKLLGHSQPQTTARYAHLAPDPVKAAAATIVSKVALALEGRTKPRKPWRLCPARPARDSHDGDDEDDEDDGASSSLRGVLTRRPTTRPRDALSRKIPLDTGERGAWRRNWRRRNLPSTRAAAVPKVSRLFLCLPGYPLWREGTDTTPFGGRSPAWSLSCFRRLGC